MDSGDNQFVDSGDNQFVDSGDSQFVDSGKVVEKPLDINWDSYTNPPPASGNDLAGE